MSHYFYFSKEKIVEINIILYNIKYPVKYNLHKN